MILPTQFQNKELKFIKIQKNSKAPETKSSWKDEMYSFDNLTLNDWVDYGGNIAIVGGYGRLRIIDCDGGKIPDFLKDLDTFIVKTPKKGYHIYIYSDDDENFDNEELNIEYRAENRYVLIPPSIHPETKTKYEVFKDRPILDLSYEQVHELLSKKKKDTSRSAQEMKKVITLLQAGKTKEDVFDIMDKEGDKWKTAHNAYKELTFNKATVWVKDHPKTERKKTIQYNDPVYEEIDSQAKELVFETGILHDDDNVDWLYDENRFCYKKTDEIDILNVIKTKVNVFQALESKFRTAYLKAIRTHGRFRARMVCDGAEDRYKYAIQFKNILYSGYSEVKREVTKDDFVHNSIPYEPKDGETIVIDKLFNEWTNGKAQTLKDIIAYSCIPNNTQKLIFFYLGPRNSGKSQFMTIMKRFLGNHNCVTTNLGILANQEQRFELINLRYKLSAFVSEIDEKTTYNTAMLKRLSGNDELRGEYKGVNGVPSFRFGGKVHIITNSLPVVADENDYAYFARTVIIDFPNSFPNSDIEICDTIPLEEYNYLASYCLKRIVEWYSTKKINILGIESVDLRAKKYLQRTDFLASFVSTHMEMEHDFEVDTNFKIVTSTFSSMFNEYLIKNGQKEWDVKRIGRALLEKYGKAIERHKRRFGEDLVWEYRGIRQKSEQTTIPVPIVPNVPDTTSSVAYVRETNSKLVEHQVHQEQDLNEVRSFLKKGIESGEIVEVRPNEYRKVI